MYSFEYVLRLIFFLTLATDVFSLSASPSFKVQSQHNAQKNTTGENSAIRHFNPNW